MRPRPIRSRARPRRPGRFFSIGVTVGMLVGFVAGSIVTLWLGDESIEAARDAIDRLTGRRDRVNFELLLQ